MSPKVPEAYLEARRAEIQQAAFKCFMEKGFHHTTMQDIYKTANLSPGAVYNYFSSKEDIVIAAIKEFTHWSISSLDSLISENPNESLTNIFQFWISPFKQDEISNSFSVQLDFYSEANRNSVVLKAVLELQDATHAILVDLIERNQREGVFNASLDSLSIARAMMGMVFGIMIHKSLDPEVDLDAYGQVFEAMITGAFSSPPKRRRRTN